MKRCQSLVNWEVKRVSTKLQILFQMVNSIKKRNLESCSCKSELYPIVLHKNHYSSFKSQYTFSIYSAILVQGLLLVSTYVFIPDSL